MTDAPTLQNQLQLALRHIQSAKFADAERVLKTAHGADPRNPDALHLLGLVAHQSGRHREGMELVNRALAIAEQSPLYWNTLGGIQRSLGEIAAAAASFRRAAEIAPSFAPAHNNLGLALESLGKLADAEPALRRAVELAPGYAPAHADLGRVLLGLDRGEDAAAALHSALDRGSADRGTRILLARALLRVARYHEAADVLGKVLAVNPGDREAGTLLDECRSKLGSDHAFAGNPPSVIRALEREANRAFGARAAKRAGPAPARSFARTRKPKLRIGYLSGDFRAHAVANLTAELFELHDRKRFEVLAYSTGPDDGSPMRQRILRAFDIFTDLHRVAFRAAAERIADDSIDILVDLSTYTEFGVPEILALRPAPIQVNFLGYPGTLGADFADYIIADRFIIPPEHAADYTEAVAYLPDCYMPNDRKRAIAEPRPTRAECGLPAEAFVFCCFNGLWKVTAGMLDLWAGLLREIPGSVLWLRDISPAATREFRAAARHYGLEERFLFAGRTDPAQHLARMTCADIFLDTLPYNAHSTASDALWAGLPVLTCVGDTFAARVCGSLLTAAGIPELVTTSLDDYRALALRLAKDGDLLKSLRERLRANRLTCPLFDSTKFTRNLESLYARIWERHLAGEKPASIDLASSP
jgi:predicted O-linked N-acetylglucosamine transferase (SPINDLY family)